MEVEAHLRGDLRKTRDQAKSAHDRLVAPFRRLKPVSLPSDQQIDDIADKFFSESGFEFREVALDFDAARVSFMRTVEKRPPSAGSQQFKDGVIWANCIRLAQEDEVVLVTDDAAFFAGKRDSSALASDLAKEVENCPHSIRLVGSLADLLAMVKTDVATDPAKLAHAIMEAMKFDIDLILEADDLTPRTPTITADYFATEDPDLIYIEFEFSLLCDDLTGEGRGVAELEIKGGCGWREAEDRFCDIKPTIMSLEYLPPSPITGQMTRRYKYAEGHAGRRDAVHIIRRKLS